MQSGLPLIWRRCCAPNSRRINAGKRSIAFGCNVWLLQDRSVVIWCFCPLRRVSTTKCVVRSGHAKHCMTRLRGHRCGEYRLSPEQTMLQRAAEERERIKLQCWQLLPTLHHCLRHHHMIQMSIRNRVITSVLQLLLSLTRKLIISEFRAKNDEWCSFSRFAATCKCPAFWGVWAKKHKSKESTVTVKLRAILVDSDMIKNSKPVLAWSCSTKSQRIQVKGPGGLLGQARSQ